MPNPSDNHYVKFMRGSVSAWENLKLTPQNINDDTLYFIYENAQSSTEGKLYLGQKLISGGGNNSENVNINDISDIYINDSTLADKQILVYNDQTDQWENASLQSIIGDNLGNFVGATSTSAGSQGLVPAPAAGDQNKFLRGDGLWAVVNTPTFDANVFSVCNNNVSLLNFSSVTNGSILVKANNQVGWTSMPIGNLSRTIITLAELQELVNNDSYDENTIYMVLNGNGSESSNKYDEYMIIEDKLELLGTFGQVDLTNYVTTTTFNTAISNLNNILQDTTDTNTGLLVPGLISRVTTIENNYITKSQIGNLNNLILSGTNTTLVEEVNTINDRLKWQELT